VSTIYRNRPRFSVFGVGAYSFAPYKVAVSGFYKKLHLVPLGRFARKPIILDDTSYFLACQSEAESAYLAGLLNSDIAKEYAEQVKQIVAGDEPALVRRKRAPGCPGWPASSGASRSSRG